jgi:hypothetical protein
MQYEAHITVDSTDTGRWQETCAVLGIRPLLIRMPEGEHPLQLMCAAEFHGDMNDARMWIAGLEASVRDAGYVILRTKLESAIVDAPTEPAVYYECHFKLLPQGEMTAALLDELKKKGIYASENLLPSADGTCYWYMTARTYGTSPVEARNAFAEAFSVIRGRLIVKAAHFEHVIFDTWPEIDKGWIVLQEAALA